MTAASGDRVGHEAGERGGVFFLERGERRIAELTYKLEGRDAIVDYTWVDPQLRGGGIARPLFEAIVAWARGEERKLHPTCYYARAVFDRNPAYDDVRRR